MASRFTIMARIGLVAAATTMLGVSMASAQGDGRFGRQGAFTSTCFVASCGAGVGGGRTGGMIFRRPGAEAPVLRRPVAQAPVLRRRGGPPPFRRHEYRQDRRHYNGDHYYRPRYYRPYYYRYRPSVYLDFSSPYYYDNDYYEPPVYSQRVYRRVQMSAEHVDWCYDRYRSYRESDNTYQPYNGPRRQCYSPYS